MLLYVWLCGGEDEAGRVAKLCCECWSCCKVLHCSRAQKQSPAFPLCALLPLAVLRSLRLLCKGFDAGDCGRAGALSPAHCYRFLRGTWTMAP